jgi:hypothetical protein
MKVNEKDHVMTEDKLTAICAEVEAVFARHGGLSKETLDAVFNRLRQKTTAAPPKETIHATQQPGDGYWAIAPGASDISEGMVWAKPVEVDGGAVRR